MKGTVTVTTNLENYSGQSMTITAVDGVFEMYGYTFTMGEFVEVWRGEGYVELFGNEWTDRFALLDLMDSNPESALKAAMINIANRL